MNNLIGVRLLNFILIFIEVDKATEAFSKELESGHKLSCPWRENCCAESLAQFPPTPPSALIDGYKDRCDGLLQFVSLPAVASSAIEYIKLTRGPQVVRLLAQTLSSVGEFGYRADNNIGESSREQVPSKYSNVSCFLGFDYCLCFEACLYYVLVLYVQQSLPCFCRPRG